MYVTQHNEIIRKRNEYVRRYCKKQGWERSLLKQDQIEEIRGSRGYKRIVSDILRGAYNGN